MIASHIHDALAQVRKLQEIIIERGLFRGYSGTARWFGGLATLVGTLIMASSLVPKTELAHLVGWGIVLAVAMVANYAGLTLWFLSDPEAKRDPQALTPAIDALAPLAAGGVLSAALVVRGDCDLLFGVWMCLYGVAHAAYRRSLPRANFILGIYYGLCGTVCLIHPAIRFVDPWPMGIVFFAGETVGGFILRQNRLNTERRSERETKDETP